MSHLVENIKMERGREEDQWERSGGKKVEKFCR